MVVSSSSEEVKKKEGGQISLKLMLFNAIDKTKGLNCAVDLAECCGL